MTKHVVHWYGYLRGEDTFNSPHHLQNHLVVNYRQLQRRQRRWRKAQKSFSTRETDPPHFVDTGVTIAENSHNPPYREERRTKAYALVVESEWLTDVRRVSNTYI